MISEWIYAFSLLRLQIPDYLNPVIVYGTRVRAVMSPIVHQILTHANLNGGQS